MCYITVEWEITTNVYVTCNFVFAGMMHQLYLESGIVAVPEFKNRFTRESRGGYTDRCAHQEVVLKYSKIRDYFVKSSGQPLELGARSSPHKNGNNFDLSLYHISFFICHNCVSSALVA